MRIWAQTQSNHLKIQALCYVSIKSAFEKCRRRILGACWWADLTISVSCSFRKRAVFNNEVMVIGEDPQHPSVTSRHTCTYVTAHPHVPAHTQVCTHTGNDKNLKYEVECWPWFPFLWITLKAEWVTGTLSPEICNWFWRVFFQHIYAVLEQNMLLFSYLLPLVSFTALRLEYTLSNSFDSWLYLQMGKSERKWIPRLHVILTLWETHKWGWTNSFTWVFSLYHLSWVINCSRPES